MRPLCVLFLRWWHRILRIDLGLSMTWFLDGLSHEYMWWWAKKRMGKLIFFVAVTRTTRTKGKIIINKYYFNHFQQDPLSIWLWTRLWNRIMMQLQWWFGLWEFVNLGVVLYFRFEDCCSWYWSQWGKGWSFESLVSIIGTSLLGFAICAYHPDIFIVEKRKGYYGKNCTTTRTS